MIVWVVLVAVVLALGCHELAHWWVARRMGYLPELLQLGLGPRVCRRRVGSGEFVLRLIPLAGQVNLPASFREQATWQQEFMLAVAGPALNATLGLLSALVWLMARFFALGLGVGAALSHACRGLLVLLGALFAAFSEAMQAAVAVSAPAGDTVLAQGTAPAATASPALYWWPLLIFAAVNLLVAATNLLPFPPLDGARMAAALLRGLTGWRLPAAVDAFGLNLLLASWVLVVARLCGQPWPATLVIYACVAAGAMWLHLRKAKAGQA
ncbi:MAG: site-2 protease family protein [Bacillota bacterium]|jgi:membrane-associated protease RseP (regulator of RpoE activity)